MPAERICMDSPAFIRAVSSALCPAPPSALRVSCADTRAQHCLQAEGLCSISPLFHSSTHCCHAKPCCPRTPVQPPLQQSAEYSVEALAARESNEDQGIVEMQITLFSYTKVVLKRVSDNVALLVRAMLVEQFGDDLATCLQQGLMASAGASAEASGRSVPAELLQLMSDSAQVQQRQDMHSVVESLEKAARRLRNIAA